MAFGLLNPRSGNVTRTSHTFAQVPKAPIERSTFDRSHGHKTTLNSGFLVPIFRDLALPGDTFALNMTFLARLNTPIFPIMDNMYADTHFFAIPIRLVWDNFKKFVGEQDNPADSIAFTIPKMTAPAGGYAEQTVQDYMELPTKIGGFQFNTLWLRAMNLCWNEHFRDQNLQNSVLVRKTDTGDVDADFTLLKRGKRHDLFTGALPWPQKGGVAVTIPLGTSAPVIPSGTGVPTFKTPTGAATPLAATTGVNNTFWGAVQTESAGVRWVDPALSADLSSATAATINAIRQSVAIQQFLERDARGGTRFPEVIFNQFGGVVHPDSRYRSEFLGGGSSPIIISPIPQTSATDAAVSPQGNLAAIGTVVGTGHGFTKSFTEWTLLLGFISIRADLTYQQGLDRFYSDQTRYDFFWPAFAHLGEFAIKNKEIFCQGTAADDDVFGYNEAYYAYRYKPSRITGKFRSNATGTLHAWHLSQNFTALPVLGDTFIKETPPVDRIVAVPAEPQFNVDMHFKLHCARPMPVYGVPGLLRF